MATQLVHLPEIERLSARVIRILGGNPGKFTLQGTNTYLLGTGPKRLLIDTGEGKPSWPVALQAVLESERATISTAVITHWHPDHVGGVNDLRKLAPDVRVHKNEPTAGVLDIRDGEKFEMEGATVKAFWCPGHATDHMAFVLEEEDAMFTGDNVLGHGTAVFEDLSTYLTSLRRMSEQFTGRAYPAHGAVIEDGRAKIQEYIRHRQQREDQIVAVLARPVEQTDQPAGRALMDIVKIIYKDVPVNLHEAAARGVLQVLKKLEDEKKACIDEASGNWRLVGQSKASL